MPFPDKIGSAWSSYCDSVEVVPDEGKEYARLLERNNKAVRNLRFAIVHKDGTFRFDGLPAGDYAMMISETVNCGMDCESGDWHRLTTFTVDEADEGPVDLGEITLTKGSD